VSAFVVPVTSAFDVARPIAAFDALRGGFAAAGPVPAGAFAARTPASVS
jgi:hypothetical protein